MRKFLKEHYAVLLAAAIVSLFLHIRIFHYDLIGQHVWRQTLTQQNIRNFAEGDANIFHPQTNAIDLGTTIHRMEFPLMQWCIAMVDKVFGYSIFISRVLMFLIGLFGMIGAGFFAKYFFTSKKAVTIFVWTFTFSPLFYYYTLNPLPDVAALSVTLWGCGYFFKWRNTRRARDLFFSGLFFALGTLMKLPFILYFALPVVAALIDRKEGWRAVLRTLFIGMWALLLPLAWYITVIPTWTNNPVTKGVLSGIHDQANDLFTYLWGNFSSTLPEILINYASVPLFIAGGWFIFRIKKFNTEKFILASVLSILILAYFLFELNLIAVNHDYYLFPFLPMIFLIVTYGALQLWDKKKWNYLVIACLWAAPFAAYLRMDNRWDIRKPGFNKELLTEAGNLKTLIPKGDSIVTIGDPSFSIWLYYLDRKGWAYMDDVPMDYVNDRTRDGAKWIVTDSEKTMEAVKQKCYYEQIIKSGTFYLIKVTASPTMII